MDIKINTILNQALKWRPKLTSLRRKLHQYPEITPNLMHTKKILENYLKQSAWKNVKTKDKNTLCFDLRGRKKGPTILLCAAMDGSPHKENANHHYSSTIAGQCHLQAHDAQMSCLANTMIYLSQFQKEFQGTIRAVFLSGENDYSGARRFIEEKLLENVDLAISLDFDPSAESGKIFYQYGVSKPRVDQINIECLGMTSQSSRYAVNPVHSAAELITQLPQSLRQQFGELTPISLQFVQINAGEAYHFQPDHVRTRGNLYTFSDELTHQAIQFLGDIIKDQYWGKNAHLTHFNLCPPLLNDTSILNFILSVISGFKESSLIEEETSMRLVGDGFAHISQFVPSVQLTMGCSKIYESGKIIHGSSHIDIDESILPEGLALFTTITLKHLQFRSQNVIQGHFIENKK